MKYVILSALLASAAQAQSVIVIRDVTVIDGTGAAPRAHMTVVVRGDRISGLRPADGFRAPAGARVIDGRGKYLIPGLIDTHAHVAFGPVAYDSTAKPPRPQMRFSYDDAASREMARTLVAFGITTVRNPGGGTQESVAMREAVLRGEVVGPRIFTAGSVIDLTDAPGLTVRVTTPEEVRAEVDRQADAGVDYIKLYASLSPPLVSAGIERANARGKKVVAHPLFTSWTEAANMRIDGIVHIVPGSPKLLPAARRQEFLTYLRGTQFMYGWFKLVDLESAEIKDMIAALTANRVTVDPTLVVFEAMFRGDDKAIIDGPDLVYAPPSLLHNWRHDFTLTMGWTPADYAEARAQWPIVLRFVKKLHDGGVHLTAGTDVPNPWVPPGASLHRELALLADAGIPNLDVLRIATRNGAESLGMQGDVGTIAQGKLADLVLLEADPVADIANTRRIAWVMKGGRLWTPDQLLPRRALSHGTGR